MQKIIILLLLIANFGSAQTKTKKNTKNLKPQMLEISCGQCQFGLKQPGCTLAVKIGKKAFFVKGKFIDDFGDAHATQGLCNAVLKAEVTGVLNNDIFEAAEINILPIVTNEKTLPENEK